MKKARFTAEKIVRIVHAADRDQIAAVAKHGVGEPSIYVWSKRFIDVREDCTLYLRKSIKPKCFYIEKMLQICLIIKQEKYNLM